MYIHVCVCDLQLYLSAYSAYVFFWFQQPLRIRVRITYNAGGAQVVEQAEVNNFPAELMIS